MDPATFSEAIERAIIGAIMRDPTLYAEARSLSPSDFQLPQHAILWAHIQSLGSQGLDTSAHALARHTFELSADHLARFQNEPELGIDALRRNVAAISLERRRVRALTTISDLARAIKANPEGWESTLTAGLCELLAESNPKRSTTAAETSARLAQRLADHRFKARLSTGLEAFDNAIFGGLPSPSLTMIGAFGKVGKTTLAASISYNLEAQGVDHVVFTLERLDTDIEALKAARAQNINVRDLKSVQPRPTARHCRYVHGTTLTVEDIRNEILYLAQIHGIRAALIDYWQLIEGREPREPVEQFRARVAQTIQKTAVDAKLPIIMFFQMGEGPQNREILPARTAANLCLYLIRDPADTNAWFNTVVSNIGLETDIGGVNTPAIILDLEVGPHFRNPAERTASDLDVNLPPFP